MDKRLTAYIDGWLEDRADFRSLLRARFGTLRTIRLAHSGLLSCLRAVRSLAEGIPVPSPDLMGAIHSVAYARSCGALETPDVLLRPFTRDDIPAGARDYAAPPGGMPETPPWGRAALTDMCADMMSSLDLVSCLATRRGEGFAIPDAIAGTASRALSPYDARREPPEREILRLSRLVLLPCDDRTTAFPYR